ncbi:hypothetical protein ACX8XN_14605 [Calditrichota bacterium GD2]
MAQTILLIDNDETTIQLFIQMSAALNIEYLIMQNWARPKNLPGRETIKAVFVNVELSSVDMQQIIKEFIQNDQEIKVPVFILYSKSFSKQYLVAKRFPHNGELKKPLTAQELFEVLSTCMDLEAQIEYPEEKYREKIRSFRAYLTATNVLINKLEAYFE